MKLGCKLTAAIRHNGSDALAGLRGLPNEDARLTAAGLRALAASILQIADEVDARQSDAIHGKHYTSGPFCYEVLV